MNRSWIWLALLGLSACGRGRAAPPAATAPPAHAPTVTAAPAEVEQLGRARRPVDSVYGRLDAPRARVKAKLSDRLTRVDARADALLHLTAAASAADRAELREDWVSFLSARDVAVDEVNGLPRITSPALSAYESRVDAALDGLEQSLSRIEHKLK